MPVRVPALIAICIVATLGFAKDKTRITLPGYVLRAETVAVIIDPSAGISIQNPQATAVAIRDVEKDLRNWGRFHPITETSSADLIIVLRKGTGRLAAATIRDPRQNSRPGQPGPIDNGVSSASQEGPGLGDSEIGSRRPAPQAEIGEANDSFLVYEGRINRPLELPPVWRYVAQDGLQSHDVPAVDAFRRAVSDADKVARKTP